MKNASLFFSALMSVMILLFGGTVAYANDDEELANALTVQNNESVFDNDSATDESSAVEFYLDIENQKQMARDIYCLTEAILFEALHEPEEGQIAVANVILNRANWNETRPKYRNRIDFKSDVCGVVNFKITKNGRTTCAFSYRCEHSFQKRLNRYMDSESWNEIKTLAIRTYMSYYSGNNVDPSEGATHYHADFVSPRWRKTYQKTTKIGAHIFYKIPE